MKRTLTLIAFLFAFSAAWSQARLGMKGGFTLSNLRMTGTVDGNKESESGNAAAGFHIGGILDLPAGRNFHIRPELLLVSKGSSIEEFDEYGNRTKLKFRPYYLELPVNFLFHKTFPRSGAAIYLGGGPVFSYGVGGKLTLGDGKIDVFNKGGLKRFDLGIGTILGFDLANGLTLSMSSNAGLLNIYDENPQYNPYDLKMRSSAWSLSIGYLLQ
jgi:hypothetical protein